MKPLMRLWEIFYLRWALAELPATHPDVPGIVIRLNALERQS